MDCISKELLSAKEKYEKAVCLIAREGSNLPNCHEHDFCKCDVDELLKEARKGYVLLKDIEVIINNLLFPEQKDEAEMEANVRLLRALKRIKALNVKE